MRPLHFEMPNDRSVFYASKEVSRGNEQLKTDNEPQEAAQVSGRDILKERKKFLEEANELRSHFVAVSSNQGRAYHSVKQTPTPEKTDHEESALHILQDFLSRFVSR